MTEKILIWYVSIGEKYNTKTSISIDTLIKIGKYDGDIVVLTDTNNFKFISEYKNDIKVINCVDLIKSEYLFLNKEWNKFICQNLKPFIIDFVNIHEYDYCIYLDSDILVNKPCFESYNHFNNILIQRDSQRIFNRSPFTGSDVLTEEMIVTYKNYGFCSGFVGVPGKQFGYDFLEKWKLKNLEYNLEYNDQGNLHWVMIVGNYIDKMKYVKDCRFCDSRNPNIYKNLITWIHFCLDNKDFEIYYKTHFNKEYIINE